MEGVGILYIHMTIWSILRPFDIPILCPLGIFGNLGYFSCFGMLYQEKSGNPVCMHEKKYKVLFAAAIQCVLYQGFKRASNST
jgi:hypothetical protein